MGDLMDNTPGQVGAPPSQAGVGPMGSVQQPEAAPMPGGAPMPAGAPMSADVPGAQVPPAETGVDTSNIPSEEWVSRVVAAAEQILYQEDVSGEGAEAGFMESIVSDDVSELGEVVVLLLTGVDDELGGAIPEEALLPASMGILDAVITLRESATGTKMTEKELAPAGRLLIEGLAEEYGGDPADFQDIVSGESQGAIDSSVEKMGVPG